MSENGMSVSSEAATNINSDNNLTESNSQSGKTSVGTDESNNGIKTPVQADSELPRSFEKRINKMYGENKRLAEQNEQLSERLQHLEQFAQMQIGKRDQDVQKKDEPTPPKREDYTDPYEYADARIAFERAKIQHESEHKQKQLNESQRAKYMHEVGLSHTARMQEALLKYDDMQDALDNMGYSSYDEKNPMHQEIMTTFCELPNSGELGYYFAKNPREFNQLFEVSPRVALLKLGYLATQVENSLHTNQNSSSHEPITNEIPSNRQGSVSLNKEDFRDFRRRLAKKR